MEPSLPRVLGRRPDPAVVQADLQRLRQLALDSGASAAEVIRAAEVVVDERVRLKCTVPRCLRAGETPHCPPYALDLELVRRAFGRFEWAVLFKCDVGPIEDYNPSRGKTRDEKRRVMSFHKKSSEVLEVLEQQAYRDGYHLAMGFGGGSCKDYLCQGMYCQALDSGRCRFPNRARPAMEAAGIDVADLINKAGWQSFALVGDLSRIPCAVTVGILFVA